MTTAKSARVRSSGFPAPERDGRYFRDFASTTVDTTPVLTS
jgi:hypothetical protein